jgi:cation diffusion facilitator family transporter
VLAVVIVVKWAVARRVEAAAQAVGSRAVEADAGHHLSDAITSAAAFIGIAVALLGGPGWESADDWAALFAGGVLVVNGIRLLIPALGDLMDRHAGGDVTAEVRRAAAAVPGVRAIEKTSVRRSGMRYFVDIHVQVDGRMPLEQAHAISGHVKATLRTEVPRVAGVLVHMEPYEDG